MELLVSLAILHGEICKIVSVQVGGPGLAVMDDPKRGIQFGAEGLSIPLTTGSSQAKAAKCRLGTYYAKNLTLSEGGRSLFAKGESLKGTELLSLKVDCTDICTLICMQGPAPSATCNVAFSTGFSNIGMHATSADKLQLSQLLYPLYRLMWQMAQQSNGVLMASCGKVKVELVSDCNTSSSESEPWLSFMWWLEDCD